MLKGIIDKKEAPEKNEIELCQFYVEPFFQNMGIGQQLLNHFLGEARCAGKERVSLWVLKQNIPARRFYEKNGFYLDGQEKLNEGTTVWDVRYVKEL